MFALFSCENKPECLGAAFKATVSSLQDDWVEIQNQFRTVIVLPAIVALGFYGTVALCNLVEESKLRRARRRMSAAGESVTGAQATSDVAPVSMPSPAIDWPGPLEFPVGFDGSEVPGPLCCPITNEVMRCPALLTLTGRTYELAAIKWWIVGNGTCPGTRRPASERDLVPNLAIRKMIQYWIIPSDETFGNYQRVEPPLHWPKDLEIPDGFDDSEAPDALLCPIMHELMRCPVLLTVTGKTYERAAIKRWIGTHGTCPIDRTQRISEQDLAPNLGIRQLVEKFVDGR